MSRLRASVRWIADFAVTVAIHVHAAAVVVAGRHKKHRRSDEQPS